METSFNLDRFLEAQESSYDHALKEIKFGRKSSHWMWYIFPQYKGLGRSEIAEYYAIKSKAEALAYYEHPILGKRLKEITAAFLSLGGKSAQEILGSPDYLKMKSCMTLFQCVQNDTDLFNKVLEKYYDGKLCSFTEQQLERKEKL